MSLLSIKNLSKTYRSNDFLFFSKAVETHAIKNVSLELTAGKTLGIVGESGSGKSTLARCLVRLIEPTQGEIFFGGRNILNFNFQELKNYRKKIQMVFQDPSGSLNPRMTAGELIGEPLLVHKIATSSTEAHDQVNELLKLVGLHEEDAFKYPHQFSGGQKQRIGIARALAVRPELLICDEPVSALDVSVQGQVLNLLKDLQEKLNLTLIFISHDLRVVNFMADQVAVMNLGSILEMADKQTLFRNPQHSYTKSLLSSLR